LSLHSILTRPEETPDLKIPLDPLEKQLYVSSRLVDISDLFGCQMEGIGDEHVSLAGFLVYVTDASEVRRNAVRFKMKPAGSRYVRTLSVRQDQRTRKVLPVV
jgi:hypothetical protein